jgi:hypothetical protein
VLELTIADNLILVAAEGQWNSEYLNNLHQGLSLTVTKVEQHNFGFSSHLKAKRLVLKQVLNII